MLKHSANLFLTKKEINIKMVKYTIAVPKSGCNNIRITDGKINKNAVIKVKNSL